MASTGILVAVGAVDFEAQLLAALRGRDLHVARRCVDITDLIATAASRQAQVAVVSSALRGLDADVVARLRDEEVAVVGVTPEPASADEAVLRSLGVELVVAATEAEQVREAVLEAHGSHVDQTRLGRAASDPLDAHSTNAQSPVAERAGHRGRVVAVWGPAGAPGRSVVALGLAGELSALGVEALVVDCDVYGGATAQLLGLLDESSGLLAATRAANTGQLGPRALAAHARTVSPSLRVLTGLPRADRWTELRPALLRQVIGSARGLADLTVLDCGFSVELDEEISYDTTAPRRNGATIAALEQADLVIVVGSADPIGLGRLVRAVGELAVILPQVVPHVVVNRMRSSLGWSTDDIRVLLTRAVHTGPLAFLPEDRAACDRALVHGKTLREAAPKSRLTQGLATLAREVGTRHAEPVSPRRAGTAR